MNSWDHLQVGIDPGGMNPYRLFKITTVIKVSKTQVTTEGGIPAVWYQSQWWPLPDGEA